MNSWLGEPLVAGASPPAALPVGVTGLIGLALAGARLGVAVARGAGGSFCTVGMRSVGAGLVTG
jgi:hypothetical protein